MTCTATKHGTYHYLRYYGCQCPEALADRQRLQNGAAVGHDPVAVQIVLEGGHARLGPADRKAAVAKLDQTGASSALIARRLHVTARSVTRIRAQLRQQAA